jgi:hypothetical protein
MAPDSKEVDLAQRVHNPMLKALGEIKREPEMGEHFLDVFSFIFHQF